MKELLFEKINRIEQKKRKVIVNSILAKIIILKIKSKIANINDSLSNVFVNLDRFK